MRIYPLMFCEEFQMKKFISLLLSLICILSLSFSLFAFVSSAEASAEVIVEGANNARPETTIVIPVSVKSSSVFSELAFEIHFDSTCLSLENINYGDIIKNSDTVGMVLSDGVLSFNATTDNFVDGTLDGKLFILKFTVLSTATNGSHDISVDSASVIATDFNGSSVAISATAGKVSVSGAVAGQETDGSGNEQSAETEAAGDAVPAEQKTGTWDKLKADFKLNFIDQDRWKSLVKGLGVTLEVTFFALLLGIAIGIIVSIVRSTYDRNFSEFRSPVTRVLFTILNAICKLYLTVIRGTPAVVQLLISYFIIFSTSNNSIMVAAITFGINSGAYVTEIFRSGIMSVDAGQSEAGRSLGLNYVQTMCYIVIPQAFKTVLPTLANEFIVLLKETSICGYIGLMDLTKAGDIIRGRTFSAFMPLLAVAAIYLIMVVLLSWLVSKLERRLRTSER